ncbi:MAG: CatA-like O-acetyltransferase [Candidatus Merdivicinus sp.]|jgi:chloramphenicol O-acetyltransferase type A
MKWLPIDMDTYPRREHFEHYSKRVRCGYGMTVSIEVGNLIQRARQENVSFYAAEIYMLSHIVNRHPEFRCSLDGEGRLGYWESLCPSYTIFHPETETFSSIWTEYEEDFAAFYRNFQKDRSQYGSNLSFEAKPDTPPHILNVSSIPWANYTDFHLDLFDGGNYLLPIFTLGKYTEQNGNWLLPVTAQVHHATCDGYHVSRLFQEMQDMADHCSEWLHGEK